jgi:NTE family protein
MLQRGNDLAIKPPYRLNSSRRFRMKTRSVCLALQGGGSHGAYTWGVVERLLEEPDVEIEAVSGASAGAMNAVVLTYGYMNGGRQGAKEALERFWQAVASSTFAGFTPGRSVPNPATSAYLSLTRYFSPYQLNPLNINPLREILSREIDFAALRERSPVRLFISATGVRDGKLRIFTERDLTREALLASACIPSFHHTVTVDGEPYWDGALTANPPLSVLVYECKSPDIILVALPTTKGMEEVPSTADAILDRFTQISFSSTLSTELHSIRLAKALAEQSWLSFGSTDRRLRRLHLHTIDAPVEVAELDGVSRFKTEPGFIAALRMQGRERAEEWLRAPVKLPHPCLSPEGRGVGLAASSSLP